MYTTVWNADFDGQKWEKKKSRRKYERREEKTHTNGRRKRKNNKKEKKQKADSVSSQHTYASIKRLTPLPTSSLQLGECYCDFLFVCQCLSQWKDDNRWRGSNVYVEIPLGIFFSSLGEKNPPTLRNTETQKVWVYVWVVGGGCLFGLWNYLLITFYTNFLLTLPRKLYL